MLGAFADRALDPEAVWGKFAPRLVWGFPLSRGFAPWLGS